MNEKLYYLGEWSEQLERRSRLRKVDAIKKMIVKCIVSQRKGLLSSVKKRFGFPARLAMGLASYEEIKGSLVRVYRKKRFYDRDI